MTQDAAQAPTAPTAAAKVDGARGAQLWQQWENAAIAVAILGLSILMSEHWWWLLALFLVFDLSAVGYLAGERVGRLTYNAVHNYVGPAACLLGYGALWGADIEQAWLLILAASWDFHVSVDRALGFGLKLGGFRLTHLGALGRH